LDKIGDETTAMTAEELRAFLEKAGHPALAMEDMGMYAQAADSGPDVSAPNPAQSPKNDREVPVGAEQNQVMAPMLHRKAQQTRLL